jgi:peptidyl-prolyl cis-trans isomerase SurA
MAYNKAIEVRALLEEGHAFDSLARIFSTEPGVDQSGGYLGHFGALQMVYPFETAAYSLLPGEVSTPVRTRFGYHLIKLHSRQGARGEVRIAHLLIRSVQGMNPEDRDAKAKKAKALYELLIQQPEQWDQVVLEHSDDVPTREKGGELGWIGPGRLIRQMDSTAFVLSNPNDLSEPFLSPFGWHILKLMDKAAPSSDFEEVRAGLLEQVKRDSRSAIAVERFQNQARELVGWKVLNEGRNYLLSHADSSLLSAQWKWQHGEKDIEPVFTADGKVFSVGEVAQFIEARQGDVMAPSAEGRMNALIEAFSTFTIMELYREKLEQVEPDYRYLLMEYRDGMLLFETMEEKVWGRSTIDTLGLKRFYEVEKEKYRQKERVKTQFLIARNAPSRSYLLKLFEAAEDKEDFLKRYQEEKSGLSFEINEQTGQFDASVHPWLSEFEQLEPLNALDLDDAYVVALVDEVIPSFIPEFTAIKGQVINDYQEFLENEWLANLKSRFPVFVNKAVFDELQKELGRDL